MFWNTVLWTYIDFTLVTKVYILLPQDEVIASVFSYLYGVQVSGMFQVIQVTTGPR